MSTTYTVKCSRCSGTGVYGGMTAAGRGGECFGCNGSGVKTVTRYTAEEKAAMQALKLRTDHALEQIKARTRELSGRRNSNQEWDALYGFVALRDADPERYVRMLDSLDAGRLDEVIHALVKYYRGGRR